MTNWESVYDVWYDQADDQMKADMQAMSQEEKEDAFSGQLSFGTAGLRGILGPGTNRMNVIIIRQTTTGLAKWILEQGEEAKQRGVAISYDNRHMSREFAFEAARVLGFYGIKTYVFDKLTPTPVLSYAVRYYQAIAGIMVTASHNPPNYNGYKVYGEDGGQFPPEAADRLTSFIQAIDNPFALDMADQDQLIQEGTLEVVGEEVVKSYLQELKTVNVDESLIQDKGSLVRFVYSAMHGTGTEVAQAAFEQAGFTDVHYEVSQCQVDPDFTTVASPNPEAEDAFELSKVLAEKVDADLLLATDPDADRLGVCVRRDEHDYVLLSGNQTASLMLDYLVSKADLPDQAAMIKSIVSSRLPDKIASSRGIETFEVLTGFKFIADKIKDFEDSGSYHYIFGYEEAIGYLVKPFVRDKDAFQALTLIAEVATYHKSQGRNLLDALELIYEEYGYYYDRTISVQYPGVSGQDKMQEIMTEVRQSKLSDIGGYAVEKIDDYLLGQSQYADGSIEKLDYPSSNVLRFSLEDGSWVALRPSGTEPKIKLYMSAIADNMADAEDKVNRFETAMRGKIEL